MPTHSVRFGNGTMYGSGIEGGKVVVSIAARSCTFSEPRQNQTDSCLERKEATIRRALGAKDAAHD